MSIKKPSELRLAKPRYQRHATWLTGGALSLTLFSFALFADAHSQPVDMPIVELSKSLTEHAMQSVSNINLFLFEE